MQDPEQPLPQQHPHSAPLSEPLDFQFPNTEDHKPPPVEQRLVIKLPPMTAGDAPPRRSSRHHTFSQESGSEYHESEKSIMEEDDHQPLSADSPQSPPVFVKSRRGRVVQKKSYRESSDDDAMRIFDDDGDVEHVNFRADVIDGDDEDDEDQPRRRTRSSSKRSSINNDDGLPTNGRVLRNRNKNPPPPPTTSSGRVSRQPKRFEPNHNPPKRLTRAQSKAVAELDDGYVDEPSDGSIDADGSFDDAPRTSSDNDLDAEGEIDQDGEGEPEPEMERDDGRPYSLRQRTTKINYAIPPALEEMKPVKPRPGGARGGGNRKRGPGWSASGAELSRWMGMGQADDSVRCHSTFPLLQLSDTFLLGFRLPHSNTP
jgi:ATPase family AAA domain-containing protein 2